MKINAEKMVLQPADAARLQKVQQEAQAEFLVPERMPANVIGMASGTKWSNGEATGEPALAAVEFHDCDREIHWAGNVRGWRTKAKVTVVQETGRNQLHAWTDHRHKRHR